MNFDIDLSTLITVGSILASAAALMWKLGKKDQQFESALEMMRAHDERLERHESDFDTLRQIINDLGKMQAVQARDHGDYDQKFKDIFARLSSVEQHRHREGARS